MALAAPASTDATSWRSVADRAAEGCCAPAKADSAANDALAAKTVDRRRIGAGNLLEGAARVTRCCTDPWPKPVAGRIMRADEPAVFPLPPIRSWNH